ncbi:MAG: hypothetical protein AUK47_11525 [Deltaproteobacteria bacterium CG2_30_63_29]|nr:MAG: hypothetical protein AUK47_11525 [Deltaproteobacteria bacterium CG2_30_63_29]PIV98334.1 MAG: hypothetical protein COW42_15270 [Deltaproteobacteria bacterium CG17_big_fil_post_rev_8_21_14_2_50_63_7]PJB49288.1 MAG: hypothetical protein CO108_00435 [Deltaproteobacteria bacterium CG_4_9_14_3_um_filter_63_12]
MRRPIRLPESSRRFRWFATCAALLLAVSCTTKALPEEKVVTLQPGDATTSAPEAPTRVPAAACTVTLTGPDTLKIGDATVSLTMGLTLDVEAEEFEVFPSLAVWPYSPNSGDEVLFAVFADPLRWLGEPRDGRLWKTRCTDPKPELMLQQEGSDFAFAVPTEDHKGLYYTGPDGAALLDLSTLESRPVTRAPILEPANCWGGEGQPADDFVVGLVHEGRELVIHRGGPCGYESDWTGVELRVQVDPFPETPLSDVGPGLRAVHGLAVVAADSEGTLWLGDAGWCKEPGVETRSTPGVVWRSDDGARSWAPRRINVESADETHPDHNAIVDLLVDAERPGHLVVLTARCSNDAVSSGGTVSVTFDGGTSWRLVPLPEELEEGAGDEGYGVEKLARTDGSIEHLVVSRGDKNWATENGGTTWEPLGDRQLLPRETTRVESGGAIFVVSEGQLLKRVAGAESAVFPAGAPTLALLEAYRERFAPTLELTSEDAPRGLDIAIRCANGPCPDFSSLLGHKNVEDHLSAAQSLRDAGGPDPLHHLTLAKEMRCEADGCCQPASEDAPKGATIERVCFTDDGVLRSPRSLEITWR